MPTQTLRPRLFKNFVLLLLSAVLTGVGAWLVTAGQVNGWLLVVFCGVGVIVFLVNLLPNSSYLRLEADGLTFCSFFRSHYYRWADLGAFRVGEISGKRMVVFNFEPHYREMQRLRSAAWSLTGHEGAFVESYGLTPERLADLLNEYRDEFAANRENLALETDV